MQADGSDVWEENIMPSENYGKHLTLEERRIIERGKINKRDTRHGGAVGHSDSVRLLRSHPDHITNVTHL